MNWLASAFAFGAEIVKSIVGKPGEKLEAPLGQSEADKAKQKIDDDRAARKANRH